jgi:hypothetical protein
VDAEIEAVQEAVGAEGQEQDADDAPEQDVHTFILSPAGKVRRSANLAMFCVTTFFRVRAWRFGCFSLWFSLAAFVEVERALAIVTGVRVQAVA